MGRWLRFIRHHREFFAYGVVVLVSFLLMSLNTNPQIQQIRTMTAVALGALEHIVSWVPNPISLARENELLRQKNMELADEVNRLRSAALENARLRSLIGLKEEAPHRYLAARVVGRSLDVLRNTLTLDVGISDGVAPGMAVVNGDGLVGRIISASHNYAIASLIPSREFRAAVCDQRSRIEGILKWSGEDINQCLMMNVSKTLDVKVGDVVETSRYSALFPQGIKVGVIEHVENDPASLFHRITVRTFVDFNRLEEVFVYLVSPPSNVFSGIRASGTAIP